MHDTSMDPSSFTDSLQVLKLSEGKHRFVNKNYKKVSARMYDYNCDVKLTVGDKTFSAHRDILSEASDYFSAMFSHDMQEKQMKDIELFEISPIGFAAMLEYFYHGHVSLDAEKIQDVIEASQFFQVGWLSELCCYYLIYHLSIENYGLVLDLMDRYALDDLNPDIFEYIGQSFIPLSEEPNFKLIQYELLYKILASDHFIAAPEGYILKTVLDWLDHNSDRLKHLEEIVGLIRFPCLNSQQLEEIREDLLAYPGIEALVTEAKEYQANPYSQCLVASERTRVRGAQPLVSMISAVDDAESIQFKVPGIPGMCEQPLSTSSLSLVLEYASVTFMGDFAFAAGGYGRSYCSTNVMYRLDPRWQVWIECAPMQDNRVNFALVNDGRYLYAIGGVDHTEQDQELLLDTVERYDPEENQWISLPKLPVPCFDIAAAVKDGCIFVSGGISDNPLDSVPVSHMSVFYPTNISWESKAPMLHTRQGHSMSLYNNKLYVFGGYSSEDGWNMRDCFINEVYDIMTDQWTELTPTPEEFGHFQRSVTVFRHKLYIIGGTSFERYLFKYDFETNQFEEKEYCGPHYLKIGVLPVAGFPKLEDEG
ncbi:kelch-like protein 32 [Lingula anatina]|uniref:Kelch-like protein 32 n=1 Tax=Lingula anatina TaxID=7574 RepID=A0A1S3H7Y1_LINAN|nr:kelch-like protein 32 [Lingula anatina]|eukprot:XP_013381234.1 kelch-like protein 32 [Lingula anatina]